MNQTLEADLAGRPRGRRPGQPRAGAAGLRPARRPHRPGPRRRRRRGRRGRGGRLRPPPPRRRSPPSCCATWSSRGSIALDGVSLTVAALGEDWVEVSLIPETLERTNLGEAVPGRTAERRVRRRGQVRGAVGVTIRWKGAGVSHMTETQRTEDAGAGGGREPVRDDRGGDRGHPPRADGRRLRRREPRERGRPDDGRPVRHARGDQLHGQGGARADLPGADPRALRRARPRPDGGQERGAVRRPPSRSRSRRGRASRTGISAARPRAHDPGRDRSRTRARATSSSPATSSRSRPKTAACSSAPARPRRRSTSRGSPGLIPAGVICEIMNDDGTMARVPDLVPYCERHGLKMVTVADLIAYRRRTEKLVERVVVDGAADRRSATSPRSATARWSTTNTTSRWSRATSTAPRTCSSASTPSA